MRKAGALAMKSFLKNDYLDDARLAQRALLEFSRALRSGRLIAFTGSMITEAYGYGDWGSVKKKSREAAKDIVVEAVGRGSALANHYSDLIDLFSGDVAKATRLGDTVAMSLIEEVLSTEAMTKADFSRHVRGGSGHLEWPLDLCHDPVDRHAVKMAQIFRGPCDNTLKSRELFPTIDALSCLEQELGIRRFATLNYDFEIERRLMLPDLLGDEAWESDNEKLKSPFAALRTKRDEAQRTNRLEEFAWDLGSGRIRRVLTGGKAVESDLLNRERIDRLIEFAVGTDDVDGHVMHMHGRACTWRSMIVSQRHYDRLYRNNDLNRLPFEFAQRLLVGGNPLLFVGLGMTEDDVNRELREFISNNPYRRAAPTFLLWNATAEALLPDEIRLRRLDWLMRLGVLTIFDTDLDPELADPGTPLALRREIKKGMRYPSLVADGPCLEEAPSQAAALAALVASIKLLGKKAGAPAREDHVGSQWRSMRAKIVKHPRGDAPIIFWNTIFSNKSFGSFNPDPHAEEVVSEVARKLCIEIKKYSKRCVIGSTGCGKGSAARQLAMMLKEGNHCLLINGGFSFDTDSVLNGIAHFFDWHFGGYMTDGRIAMSRSAYFRKVFTELTRRNPFQRNLTIIVNGMERFFTLDGDPISAEFEELMRLACAEGGTAARRSRSWRPEIRWVLFGTERVRRYLEGTLKIKTDDVAQLGATLPLLGDEALPFWQLDEIRRRMNKVLSEQVPEKSLEEVAPSLWRSLSDERKRFISASAGKLSGDSNALRRAFYALVLDNQVLAQVIPKTTLVEPMLKCLRQLAFFGLPVELAVLRHAVNLGDQDVKLEEVLGQLVDLSLVLRLEGFPSYGNQREHREHQNDDNCRFVLHRSLLAELRYRFGIPLTEAKLSTAFNMSLYVAQPVDGFIPEPEIHDELGELIDGLLDAYRAEETAGIELWEVASAVGWKEADFLAALHGAAREAGSCSIEFSPEGRAGAANDPKLESARHIYRLCGNASVQCLRAALAVVRGYYSTSGILTLDRGDRLLRDDRDGILLEHAERLDRVIDTYGKMARAREYLRAQHLGLFEALYCEAEPFYPDELVWLHNERGVVRLAMGDLYEARVSFDRAMRVNRDHVEFTDRAHNWRRIRLNQLTVEMEGGNIGLTRRMAEEILALSDGSDLQLREDKLAAAIARGYIGWCLHLNGEHKSARTHYGLSAAALSKLGEVRAQAYVSRLAVNAHDPSDGKGRLDAIREVLQLAQSTRQMDIVHRVNITMADAWLFTGNPSAEVRQRANRLLEDAMQYALQADVHRVRCEASMTIAKARHDTGDYEGALRYTSDALMIATRNGLELRKITLRADFAKTLAARGHPVTAEHLAQTAIKAASRQRFQTAIERAERVLIGMPNLSAISNNTDTSGTRNY